MTINNGYYSDWYSLSPELKSTAISRWGNSDLSGYRYRIEDGQINFRSPLPENWVHEEPSELASKIPVISKPVTYVDAISID